MLNTFHPLAIMEEGWRKTQGWLQMITRWGFVFAVVLDAFRSMPILLQNRDHHAGEEEKHGCRRSRDPDRYWQDKYIYIYPSCQAYQAIRPSAQNSVLAPDW